MFMARQRLLCLLREQHSLSYRLVLMRMIVNLICGMHADGGHTGALPALPAVAGRKMQEKYEQENNTRRWPHGE
jgi:hypothetical protein